MKFISCLVVLAFSVSAFGQAALRDYDRRATAALFTLNKPKVAGKWDLVDASKITDKDLTLLNLFHSPPADERYAYALNFGKGKSAGAHKIEVGYTDFGATMAPKDREKWKAHPSNDPKDPSKVEFYYKDPPPGDFNEVVARRRIGGLQLSVVLRQPLDLGIDKPIELANTRLADLAEMAQQYKLFTGGKIRQVVLAEDNKTELGDISEQKERFAMGSAPKTLTVRVEVVDDEGAPHKSVKEMSIELAGALASVAKVEVPGARKEGDRFIIDDPKTPRVDVKVTLPAATSELEAKLLEERKSNAAGLRIKAGAKLK